MDITGDGHNGRWDREDRGHLPPVRILVWPAGGENDATAMYRLLLPARALQAEGADVVIDTTGPTVYWSESWEGMPEPPAWVKVLGCAKPDCDVVVMQRPGRRWWSDLMPFLQAHGVKVVVDVDDRFDRIDPRNVAHGAYNPQSAAVHAASWIDEACKRADVVTCSTVALAQRYGFGHGRVLPNRVPERYLWMNPEKRPRTVGWTGTTETHPGDLEVTGGAVQAIPDGWSVHVIGTGVGVAEALKCRGEQTATGWVPFAEYPERYAELDLAIVPLADTPFNLSKSGLKATEAASLGVPVVMSPTPDNIRVHKLGVGVLANSPGQWRRHLRRLTRSDTARAELAAQGRAAMADQTVERNAHRWLAAWLSAAKPLRKAA